MGLWGDLTDKHREGDSFGGNGDSELVFEAKCDEMNKTSGRDRPKMLVNTIPCVRSAERCWKVMAGKELPEQFQFFLVSVVLFL